MRLISHGLTPIWHLLGIHGLITFGKLMQPPWVFSALPPRDLYEASPKAISGRTSYLRVRLEFLRYPHLIPTLFNGCGFGPPWPFTATSSWTWIGHPVSGLRIPNFALFRLGFPPAPRLKRLTIPVSAARRTVLQKVRGHTWALLMISLLHSEPSLRSVSSCAGEPHKLRFACALLRLLIPCPSLMPPSLQAGWRPSLGHDPEQRPLCSRSL